MCNNDYSQSEAVNSSDREQTEKPLAESGQPSSNALRISHGAPRHWRDCRLVLIGGACGPGRQETPRIALVSSGGRHIPFQEIKQNPHERNTITLDKFNSVVIYDVASGCVTVRTPREPQVPNSPSCFYLSRTMFQLSNGWAQQ